MTNPEGTANDPATGPGETFASLAAKAFVLTGPTASGKSSIAACWAERIGGEILSLDSIAVYRQMDIGTAKPSADDRRKVPHHLIDLVEPSEDFSVACYLAAAHRVVDEVRNRGKVPIFVGGTPMFLKGILRGFDPGPPADWEFRHSVEQDIKDHGIDALRERLRQVDPLSAHRIERGDTRRMIRALEVAHATGQPISHRQTQFDKPAEGADHLYALHWPRAQLHQRIQQRVAAMFSAGLVDEVAAIRDSESGFSRTASQAVGYREILQYLDGKLSLDQATEQVVFHTRRLARRQETWLRSFTEIQTIEVCDPMAPDKIADWLSSQTE